MGFVGVYKAIYDYAPQGEGELSVNEGDVVLVLEKSEDDDWWRAKKKAAADEEEEPEGLVPNNYIEEVSPTAHAKALYDYDRQTDEEISFTEDAALEVYDTSDPDWTLVGLDGEFGFAPANYIELKDASISAASARARAPSTQASQPRQPASAAAAIAGIMHQKTNSSASAARSAPQYTPEASDDDEPPPPKPVRPDSTPMSPPPTQFASPRSPSPPGVISSPTIGRGQRASNDMTPSPGGYHLYNIHEMISHLGKNKKMPTTLGINSARGIIMIAPEKSRDGPSKEWTAEKLTHYSLEGKHVFMELVRPSQSIDFHAGAKDTAREIVAALGELAGAARAAGLKEVLAAGTGGGGRKRGKMLYDFMAQGEDEVTVAVEDEVIVIDDTQSEEWWMVRRLKNGKEGVVPSSYVEIIEIIPQQESMAVREAKSTVEQNRLEEERLTREAVKSGGVGLQPPDRGSSLSTDKDHRRSSQRSKRSSKTPIDSDTKSKPSRSRTRMWTDRTGSFKVEAEFLGLKDGKIHLHKLNGVKIAVPVGRMAVEDLEYVEKATGQSLEDEKPLADIKRRSNQRKDRSGAAVESSKPTYDWFDFFLQCGVNPQICERYASAFDRDQMGEENMQDINPSLLRTLGLKEGDILRVVKFLDAKFERTRAELDTNGTDGLFSGPGGTLRNNTRKGRPAPAVASNDTVDPRAFEQDSLKKDKPPDAAPAPTRMPTRSGFEDDAWNVKASTLPAPATSSLAQQRAAVSAPIKPTPTGALAELSLLSPPLQPIPALIPQLSPPPMQQQFHPVPQQQPIQSHPNGANRQFFDQLASTPTGIQSQQVSAPRQRPQAPPQNIAQNSLLPPPPPTMRSTSAPQNQQQNTFGPPPLQPQMTGYQQSQPTGYQQSQPTGYQTQMAPPGQSLNYQQSFNPPQLQTQPTGFGYPGNQQNLNQSNGQQSFNQPQQQMQPQPTGFYPQQPQQQQFLNSQQNGSPFADPPRQPFQTMQPMQTGYQENNQYPAQPQMLQPTGVNSYLPPALQPQPTGMNGGINNGMNGSMNNGMNPLGAQQTGFGQPPQQMQAPPIPPMPQQQTNLQPLQPHKTGPAPPIRFGTAAKLVPQPTGRANLANATPQNPFGF